MEKYPITTYCNGTDELTSAAQFASHFSDNFKYVDYVKSKNRYPSEDFSFKTTLNDLSL